MLLPGDLFIWVFPNAGNPQKVQRYPDDWAVALRKMAVLGPELFVPAHGLPIVGTDRISMVLDEAASALEFLVAGVLESMNAGMELEAIVEQVKLPAEVLEKPYLTPVYDEPEFVVRNIWRRFGGWWDGNAASLKPPTRAAVGGELLGLAGGADPVITRAQALADDGELALAAVQIAADVGRLRGLDLRHRLRSGQGIRAAGGSRGAHGLRAPGRSKAGSAFKGTRGDR